MERSISKFIKEDLSKKIILLSGPRQTGKTTLSKSISQDFEYLNYDKVDNRLMIKNAEWDRKKSLLIFDELHKLEGWKGLLKGIADTEKQSIIVTGSARLNTYRKVGDSLAGRFFYYRLHPLDVKEVCAYQKDLKAEEVFNRILKYSGFPEPFFEASSRFYGKWRESHSQIILKQDLVDLEKIDQLAKIELLVELLRSRVGSTVSYSSLARDLEADDKSIKRWITILENLYIIFRLQPYSKNVARSLLKAQKFYFYDTAAVLGDQGALFENLVACALLKEIHYVQDCLGEKRELFFLRNKDGDEVDFVVTKDSAIKLAVECKWRDDSPHGGFKAFSTNLTLATTIQLVADLQREKTFKFGLELRKAAGWLEGLDLL